jgi:hypothetical protein
LTRCSLAPIPSPIPRWHRMLLALLASHPAFGLRLKFTDSASTLPFSRLAQCSFPLWSRCSLIPPCGTFCIGGLVLRRYQRLTPRLLPAGATVAGWVSFLPLDQRALSTAHEFCGLVIVAIRDLRGRKRDSAQNLAALRGSQRFECLSRSIGFSCERQIVGDNDQLVRISALIA